MQLQVFAPPSLNMKGRKVTDNAQDPCRVMAEAIWDADQHLNPHTKEPLRGPQTEGWDKEAFIDDLAILILDHTVLPETVEKLKLMCGMIESLPDDIWGKNDNGASGPEYQEWPVKEEVLSDIQNTIAKAEGRNDD